eukprot:GILJ01024619.1.p1 GENE.GILJ01024619.1~~GILJ01024619.1.p1  ORF type:complete len:295 (+),score=25.12 GILJ01024619.1:891-1775(+)
MECNSSIANESLVTDFINKYANEPALAILRALDTEHSLAMEVLRWAGIERRCRAGEIYFEGTTPLMIATLLNRPRVVRELISLGVDVNAGDVSGRTALHIASTYKACAEIVKILLTSGANPNTIDNARNTPLNLALSSDCLDKTIDLMFLHGAQLHSSDGGRGNISATGIQVILKHGASVNDTFTINSATFGCRYDQAKIIMDNGADVDAIDNAGNSPLHNAIINFRKRVNRGLNPPDTLIKLLVEENADLTIKDRENRTPLELFESKKDRDQCVRTNQIKEYLQKFVQLRKLV